MKIARKCKHCGNEFFCYEKEPDKFCSRKCYKSYTKGVNHPNFKHGASSGSIFVCLNCGISGIRKQYRQKYCSSKCQMNFEYKTGVRCPHKTSEKAHSKMRELVQKGEWILQQNWVHIKSNKMLSSKKYGGTFIEKKMLWLLEQKGINYEKQKLIYRDEYRRCGTKGIQKRFYIVDFYLPDYNIIIECDGIAWHNDKEYDSNRQEYLEQQGFAFLRFSENDIRNNLKKISTELELLYNSN